MKKSIIIGKLNPNKVKSRDLVHLQEITNGTGVGGHKSLKDFSRKNTRKVEREALHA